MDKTIETNLVKIIPVLVILWCVTMFAALYNGWFDCLTFSTCRNDLKGIDFFAVPKSFINLTEGRSAFDTWGGEAWGPYATWYLAHPAYSVFVASWFSFFDPWTSYWVFGIFSLILFAASAWLISKDTDIPLLKVSAFFFLLCSMLTFAVLYTGNMHAPIVLSITLILSALYKLAVNGNKNTAPANKLLMGGLLLSFFSKPVVVLFMPVLLINRLTRKTAFISLCIYAVVSLLFLVIPAFNPESIGISRTIEIALDPAFIKENLNIYKNNYVLNEYMKDNSIHWLNLIAQSDHYWNHVDIFSLSAFLNTLAGRQLPGIIYKLPIYIGIGLSLMAWKIKDAGKLSEFTLFLVAAIALTFFLGYNTVWEYQYALVLPLLAYIPVFYSKQMITRAELYLLMGTGIFFLLPNLYFLFPKDQGISTTMMTIIRLDRVIPAVVFFIVFTAAAVRRLRS